MNRPLKTSILLLINTMMLFMAETAQAFQSSKLDCGFKYILPPLAIALILGPIALIMTIVILVKKKPNTFWHILAWWIVPILSIITVIISSNLC